MAYAPMIGCKVSKGAKIRNRNNQVPHLTQDTNGKVTNSQLNTTNESQDVSLLLFSTHFKTLTMGQSKFKIKPYETFPAPFVSFMMTGLVWYLHSHYLLLTRP